jgi:hypothetical protein
MTSTTIDRPKARKRALRKLNKAQRQRIEAAVQAMLDVLDAVDAPSEDLEENDQGGDEHDGAEPSDDEEPSLGSFDAMTDQRKSWRRAELPLVFLADDAELEHDGREPDVDDEEDDPAEDAGNAVTRLRLSSPLPPRHALRISPIAPSGLHRAVSADACARSP